MSELNYPASSLKDLEVFEEIVEVLESRNANTDFAALSDGLTTHTEYMIVGMQLQLMADPLGIFMGLDLLKLKCIELMHRLLAMRLKAIPVDDELGQSAAPIWSVLLCNVQDELEVLFIYFCRMDLKGYLFTN